MNTNFGRRPLPNIPTPEHSLKKDSKMSGKTNKAPQHEKTHCATENDYTYINPEDILSHRQQRPELEDIWDVMKKLTWNDRKYKLSEFLSLFELPQIVKVHYGDFDASGCNLRIGDTLVLHKVSTVRKVIAKDSEGETLHLPLVSPMKVDLRPTNYKECFDSTEELAKVMPKFVRIAAGYYGEGSEDSVYMGQKLKILRMDYQRCILECEDYQTGQALKLTQQCEAQFRPLQDTKEYSLEEVVRKLKLPASVQFVDSAHTPQHRRIQRILTSSIGVIQVERSYTDTSLIASTKSNGERVAKTFPPDCELVVLPAQGAVNCDPSYKKLCQRFQGAIDFTELEMAILADVFNKYGKRYLLDNDILKEGYKMNDYVSLRIDPRYDTYASISDLKLKPEVKTKPPKIPPRKKSINKDGDAPQEKPPLPEKPSLPGGVTTLQGIPQKDFPVPQSPVRDTPQDKQSGLTPLNIPDDLSTLSVMEICHCLEQINMGQYVQSFQEERIDGCLLMNLDEESLLSLGLTKFHCKKLQRLMDGWRPNTGVN